MVQNQHPQNCRLCSAPATIDDAGFRQRYFLERGTAITLNWWKCRRCGGWFCFPLPDPEQIQKHWSLTYYNNPQRQEDLKQAKDKLDRRMFAEIPAAGVEGVVLDHGCGFGNFLEKCRAHGISAEGFEPNSAGVAEARRRGFVVHEGWEIEHAQLPDAAYRAIMADDAFCLCWHPFAAVKTFFRLLAANGRLIMRLTNKHWLLCALRRCLPAGEKRNRILTTVLQDQFHTVALTGLRRILQEVGFRQIRFLPRAYTMPFSLMPWSTRLAYSLSDVLYAVSFTSLNIYPGVILVCEKPPA